jgi:cyclohexadienyl dehydratase
VKKVQMHTTQKQSQIQKGVMNFFNTLFFPKQRKTSLLDQILNRGLIKVGTTGDYKPFTYYNSITKTFEGYDIAMGHKLAKDLGVKVEFVKTTWNNLTNDLLANRFDIAMGGISRNLERQKAAHLTSPYLSDGKVPLIRKLDKNRFTNISSIDKPNVRIGVNPGGTNEAFVNSSIRQASIMIVPNNLDIPDMVAAGIVDVMITDSVEAQYYEKQNSKLCTASVEKPFTNAPLVYMIPRGDLIFQNWMTLWMEENERSTINIKEKQLWGLTAFSLDQFN